MTDSDILRFFKTDHLPEELRGVSDAIRSVALWLGTTLPNNPERQAGLRKLLEAKDCFVRAKLSGDQQTVLVPTATFVRMRDAELMLQVLEALGVDNWEGYERALAAFDAQRKDSDV